MPSENNPVVEPTPEPALYDDLKHTPARKLTNSIEKVDGLSPEEEQAQERGGALALRGTKRKVLRWCYVAFFCFGVAVAVVIVSALIAMLGIYIYWITKEGKIEDIVGSILAFVFGVATTLAVEFIVKRTSEKH